MNAVAEKNLSRIQREKRSKIQKAALEVFSEYGLRSATLDKIATACGLTKPNILYYYSSKDQIYFEVLNDHWVSEGKLANVSGYHLFFSIWAMTQHYADFDVQVKAILDKDEDELFQEAEEYLTNLLLRMLSLPSNQKHSNKRS